MILRNWKFKVFMSNFFLIGPGGIGKSTVGPHLANFLDVEFIDLDREFEKYSGDIAVYIREKGYKEYAKENSRVFFEVLKQKKGNFVFALSSGFLVYEGMEELVNKHISAIENFGKSVLLSPRESLEQSLEIVVKRQMKRGFDLNEEKEREKYCKRLPLYKKIADAHVISESSPKQIACNILIKFL